MNANPVTGAPFYRKLLIISFPAIHREKISGLNQGQEDILRAKEAIDMERETLNMDKKSLANLRSEHSRLKANTPEIMIYHYWQ